MVLSFAVLLVCLFELFNVVAVIKYFFVGCAYICCLLVVLVYVCCLLCCCWRKIVDIIIP